ncbi:MAG: amidohydrolase [Acidimicrobiia bacterium]
MHTVDYPLFDADNHYYEARDAFTRHLEPRYRDRAIELRLDHETGREHLVIAGEPFTFLPRPPFETAPVPGALAQMMRGGGDNGERPYQPMAPAFVDRDARLAAMDDQGIEAAVLLPSIGVTVEHQMRHDPVTTYANLRAFNRWLDEDWGFSHRDRIIGVPLLSLLDVDLAVAELEWALGRGARLVHLRPTPVNGRSLADPVFDPFWARVDEARVPVAFHLSESGYNELMSVHWGEPANPSSHRQSALQWAMFYGDRPIMDTLAALVYGNLFGRFPGVKVVSIENGASWVGYLMKRLDKMKGMGRHGLWIGGRPTGKPSEIFRAHVVVSPYHEDDHEQLIDCVGVDQIVFGSDWPHPEGLAEPRDYATTLPPSIPDADVRKILRENGRRLVGLPAPS